MTNEEHKVMIEELEEYAKRDVKGYKLKVFWLAILGYGYIFFILALLLLVLFILGYLMISGQSPGLSSNVAIPIIFLVLMILKSLRIKFPWPEGIELSRKKVPRLFQLINEIRTATKSPRIDYILLNGELNASIIQRPVLGIFGLHQHFLVLGLPLMLAVSPEHFQVILIHELGHLSNAHGRFGSWIYRVRETWVHVLEAIKRTEQLQKKRYWGNIFFDNFFKWYIPYFEAYSSVLIRTHEYEADGFASNLIGSRETAAALVNLSIKSAFLEQCFWPEIYRIDKQQPEPPKNIYQQMETAFQEKMDKTKIEGWLTEALIVKTDNYYTHPSLSERLRNLREEPVLQPFSPHHAAEKYLDEAFESLQAILNKKWFDETFDFWKERFQQLQDGQQRLTELELLESDQSTNIHQEIEKARLKEELSSWQEALAIYERILEQEPENAVANFEVGRILLIQKKDPTGVTLLEKVMERDNNYIQIGCWFIYRFFIEQGDESEAEKYRIKGMERAEIESLAQQERSQLFFSDQFLPHDLTEDQLEAIVSHLEIYPQIQEVLIVKKRLNYLPEQPLYIVGFTIFSPFFGGSNKICNVIRDKLALNLPLPASGVILAFLGDNMRFRRKFIKIPGSRVYCA